MLISAARIGVKICAAVGIGSDSLNFPDRSLSIVKDADFVLRAVSLENRVTERYMYYKIITPLFGEKIHPVVF
jgi:hypothetical protein